MDFMNDQFQQKFQQLLQLKELYSTKNVLPQRIQRLKLCDLNFQIKQIRQQQQKKLDYQINSSINSQQFPKKQYTHRNISNQNSCLNIADQSNICLSCEKYIFEKKIELNCYKKYSHSYHAQCLGQLMKQQLILQCTKFECLCKCKINLGDINRTKIVEIEVFVNRLLENQAKFIKSHLDYIKVCAGKDCDFFWIVKNQRSRSISHSPNKQYKITYLNYCPECRFI